MANELKATKWGTIQDLSVTDGSPLTTSNHLVTNLSGIDATNSGNIEPTGKINGAGTIGTMGHYCYFHLDGGVDTDYTHPFDFPVTGDFSVIVNSTANHLDDASTVFDDVFVQGSIDGVNYSNITEVINNGNPGSTTEGNFLIGIYDVDTYGILPYMRIAINVSTPPSAENIFVNVVMI